MSTQFKYGGNIYNAIYIDLSAVSNGDGILPSTPFNTWPSTINTSDAWIVRRSNTRTVIPSISSSASSFIMIGCPRTAAQSPFGVKDLFYDIVPAEVITAWGADSAKWAYFTSGGNNFTFSNLYGFAWAGLKIQRESGVSANPNYLINNTVSNTPATYSNLHPDIYIGGCSFGRYGDDVDCDGTESFGRYGENNSTAFTTQLENATTGGGMFKYLQFTDSSQVTFENCIINYGGSNSTGGHGFRILATWKVNISNVVVNKVTGCCDVGVFFFNENNQHKCLSMNIINYTEHIIVNGTATLCANIPCTIYAGSTSAPIDYLVMHNINVDMPRVLGTPNRTGTNLNIYNGLFRFHETYVRYCDIENINLNLNKVWYYRDQNGMPFRINVYGTVGYVAGATRKFKNIFIQMGEDADVAYGSYGGAFTNTDYTPSNYNVFYLNGNCSDVGGYYGGSCPITVDNITVNNERGKAAHITGAQVTNASFKGMTCFGTQTKADITSISSWYPGGFIGMEMGATVHIGTVTANVENGYTGAQQCVYTSAYGITLIVDHCNTSLVLDNKSAGETWSNYDYLFLCKSAMEYANNTNFFMADSYNQYARSTNIYRTGGSPAGIMFINSFVDNVSPMILGRSPLLGQQVTIPSAGRYCLSYYVAAKGYANLTVEVPDNRYVSNRFKIKVRVPQDTAGNLYEDCYANTRGVYREDTTSVWNNEDDLTKWRIDIYIDCPTANPLGVEFEFNWFGAVGCKFLLDPKAELVKLDESSSSSSF